MLEAPSVEARAPASHPERVSADAILEVSGLVKDFGRFRAVDKVSFTVPRGKIIGLLGPN
ncbi:MAG TPA: ABC transporter ATP-binding protein, partial [bacterium]